MPSVTKEKRRSIVEVEKSIDESAEQMQINLDDPSALKRVLDTAACEVRLCCIYNIW